MALERLDPFVGNSVEAIQYAGHGAGNGADGVGIAAEVDGCEYGLSVAVVVHDCPE